MYKKILSIFLSFTIFLSFPVSVYASDSEHGGSSGSIEDDYPYIPLTDNIIDEIYFLYSKMGAYLAPGISIRDVTKDVYERDSSWFNYLRLNPSTNELEIKSLYRHDSTDGITYPSEFLSELKRIVQEYPQTKTGISTQKEYAIIDQIGLFNVKGYLCGGNGKPSILEYFCSAEIDTTEYKVFCVRSDYDSSSYKIDFYKCNTSNFTTSIFSLSTESYLFNTSNGNYVNLGNSSYSTINKVTQYSFNIPVFTSIDEGVNWVKGDSNNQVKQSYLTNYYLSSKFNQTVDNSVTITQEMLTKNFQEINNNYYNNVYNYVTNYNNENDTTLDTSALQAKIDEMQSSLDQILEELQNSPGGGSGEGSGSGDSSGDPSQDYSKDLEVINSSLSDIYKKLEEFYLKYKDTVDSEIKIDLSNIEKSLFDLDKLLTEFSQDNLLALQDMYKRLDDILTQLKNPPAQTDYSTNFDNIEQILADIELLLSSDTELYHSSLSHIEQLLDENNKQNKNFFDKVLVKFDDIITYLKKIYRVNVVDTIADIVSAITDLFDFASLAQRSSETANLVKTKFPFCMPFDLFATLGVLSAPAVIPHFELPFNFNIFGTQTENTISIDLTQYEKLATFSRDAFTVLFVVGLIMLTIKVFHGGDDDD